ncbi:MAG: hypothetical protein ACXABG_11140 [Promethearchaeota archaeon]|jgi:hypothetical protein
MAGISNNTFTLAKPLVEKNDDNDRGLNQKVIINLLFRYESLIDEDNKIRTPHSLNLDKIAKKANTAKGVVLYVLNNFFRELNTFHDFLSTRYENWRPGKSHIIEKLNLYLENLHITAPVFNYERAKKNIDVLYYLLSKSFYWPHITTQLALLIFVTDRNDPDVNGKAYILQKNLRMLCCCSAYAFHCARNRLSISKEGKLSNNLK